MSPRPNPISSIAPRERKNTYSENPPFIIQQRRPFFRPPLILVQTHFNIFLDFLTSWFHLEDTGHALLSGLVARAALEDPVILGLAGLEVELAHRTSRRRRGRFVEAVKTRAKANVRVL